MKMISAIAYVIAVLMAQSVESCNMAGMEDSPGYCQVFNRGGSSKVHFYSCCNNYNEQVPPSCDGFTYHTASKDSQCGKAGKSTGKGCRKGDKFKCGGCQGQNEIYAKCKKWFKNIPGFCWYFTYCFRSNCKSKFNLNFSLESLPIIEESAWSCGDGVCAGNEDVENCALDCCASVNPICSFSNSSCTPQCCSESSCCLYNEEYPPIGTIIDWYPMSNVEFPYGYELCDGGNVSTPGSILYSNLKPDLRDRFIMGASDSQEAGTKGGATQYQTSSVPAHQHTVGNGFNENGNICGSCSHCSSSLAGCGRNSFDPPEKTGSDQGHFHNVQVIPPYIKMMKLIKVL